MEETLPELAVWLPEGFKLEGLAMPERLALEEKADPGDEADEPTNWLVLLCDLDEGLGPAMEEWLALIVLFPYGAPPLGLPP